MLAGFSPPQAAPRIHCHAPLEPVDGIYHGAGQDLKTWRHYAEMMQPHGLQPDFFMEYLGLRGLKPERLGKLLAYYDGPGRERPLLQLGLSMTSDGNPEQCYAHEVADGKHDDGIHLLGAFLEKEKLPSLIRIGYECTGPWNGYESESYVAAFRRVAELLRGFDFPLATVWCVEGGWTGNADPYDPGDNYADWWSVDLFAPEHFEAVSGFMDQALEHKKPVLIGECTPRRVGVLDGADSWKAWFELFFSFIARYPNLKGFSYINWNWSGFPQWQDWGDGRLQENELVLKNWIQHVGALPKA